MCYDGEFIGVLSLACGVIGIIIGIIVTVCYKKVMCTMAPSDGSTHSQHALSLGGSGPDRHFSNFTLNELQASSVNPTGNPARFPMPHYPIDGSSTPRGLDNNTACGNSLRVTRDRRVSNANSTYPEYFPSHKISDSTRPVGVNRLNRSCRQSSKKSNDRSDIIHQESSPMTCYMPHLARIDKSHNSDQMGCGQNNYVDNTSSGTNIKEHRNKSIPVDLQKMSQNWPGFQGMDRDLLNHYYTGSKNSDKSNFDDDLTLVKRLQECPEDLRYIYEPCETSRTINLREKKLVYVCKMLDYNGGLLQLEKMGISLSVPRGAIPQKQRQLVTLVLNWDLTDNPKMMDKEALVSPVVYCGPHGSEFSQPCVLKFKHCAYDTRYARILTSSTDLFEAKDWQNFDDNIPQDYNDEDVDGDDNYDDDDIPYPQSGVSVTLDECQVEVSHFSLFTCTTVSKNKLLRKWIQVAVFTHDLFPERRHQEIRIYFLNKTPCALQWAIQNEDSFGRYMACPDTTFLFTESGEDMMVHLSSISDGWESVTHDTEEPIRTILFEQIWHGACPHSVMCFRKKDNNLKSSSNIGETSFFDTNAQEGFADVENSSFHSESKKRVESSEINIALTLHQELNKNASVPLNILTHNLKVTVCDTEVKVIDEGPS